jgi:hypothetical protein
LNPVLHDLFNPLLEPPHFQPEVTFDEDVDAYGWESELYFTSDEEEYDEVPCPSTPPINVYVEVEEEEEEDEVVEETVEVEASSSVVFLPQTPTDVSFVGETPSPGPSRRTSPRATARFSPYSRR